eukprot:gene46761-36654_t
MGAACCGPLIRRACRDGEGAEERERKRMFVPTMVFVAVWFVFWDWDHSDKRMVKKMLSCQQHYDLSNNYTIPDRLPVREVFAAKQREYEKRYGQSARFRS